VNPERLTRCLIAGGIALLVFSFVWPALVGGRRAYTEEDALEFQKASAELRQQILSGHHHHDEDDSHAIGDSSLSDRQAAQERFERIQAKRDAAFSRGQTTAAWSRWLGILCLCGGVGIYAAQRRTR